jgi:hypothetical protein
VALKSVYRGVSSASSTGSTIMQTIYSEGFNLSDADVEEVLRIRVKLAPEDGRCGFVQLRLECLAIS